MGLHTSSSRPYVFIPLHEVFRTPAVPSPHFENHYFTTLLLFLCSVALCIENINSFGKHSLVSHAMFPIDTHSFPCYRKCLCKLSSVCLIHPPLAPKLRWNNQGKPWHLVFFGKVTLCWQTQKGKVGTKLCQMVWKRLALKCSGIDCKFLLCVNNAFLTSYQLKYVGQFQVR